jgi:hypothetical protein
MKEALEAAMFTPQLSLEGNPSVAVQPQFDILL